MNFLLLTVLCFASAVHAQTTLVDASELTCKELQTRVASGPGIQVTRYASGGGWIIEYSDSGSSYDSGSSSWSGGFGGSSSSGSDSGSSRGSNYNPPSSGTRGSRYCPGC